MQDVFVNPFTDFGFKKLFGEEPNKDLLISFLNTLLPDKHQIASLQYSKNEHQGATALDRKAIFDLSCKSATGERFIVELQKAKQNFFKDRSVYYATFPIQEQAQRGEWDFQLAAVYTIGILDFVFDEDAKTGDQEVIHAIQLKNQHGRVFYDKLTFIYLTLPHFRKTLAQLDNLQDKWLYVFRHLHEFDDIPPELKEDVFAKVFAVAKIAKFSRSEQTAYRDSLKYYWDLKNVTDTAWEEGHERGRKQGLEEGREQGIKQGLETGVEIGLEKGIAKTRLLAVQNAHNMGLSAETIAGVLQLELAEVERLLAQVNN
ncbi:Rpn family recombination-promoting nuclease/putative transposase [Methylovulum psychrotolerans]|uniref:Transposase n=1 Tax=Methylovulum psychrotolerans TaxID=1704499 RepID=A0A2S5CH23_9GAMM|nr:Rpn family recombination-promoting nuclease/putative transposase [Methylovulum psychrotolerans]POZ50089.1 transposase [Methylovulum psychrotolerans]